MTKKTVYEKLHPPLVKGVRIRDTHSNGIRYQGETSGGRVTKVVRIKKGR